MANANRAVGSSSLLSKLRYFNLVTCVVVVSYQSSFLSEMKDAFYKETHKKNTRPSLIFSDPEEQNLLRELQDKYEMCKKEDEEITEAQHDVLL